MFSVEVNRKHKLSNKFYLNVSKLRPIFFHILSKPLFNIFSTFFCISVVISPHATTIWCLKRKSIMYKYQLLNRYITRRPVVFDRGEWFSKTPSTTPVVGKMLVKSHLHELHSFTEKHHVERSSSSGRDF